MQRYTFPLAILSMFLASHALGHDTWLQANTPVVRVGDVVHVDLMLGNHGNDHRDFKLAGKATLNGQDATVSLVAPDGAVTPIASRFRDLGLGPKEGFLSAAIRLDAQGIYTVAHTSDKVVSYAPKRSVKSGRVCVLASESIDKPPTVAAGFDRVLGHALEVVPLTNPVAAMGVGTAMKVRVLFKGQPLAKARVSFIPRGVQLTEGFDSRHERMTDDHGYASCELTAADYHLIVVHHQTDEQGPGYESTKYSATLCVYVPAVCPCCGE